MERHGEGELLRGFQSAARPFSISDVYSNTVRQYHIRDYNVTTGVSLEVFKTLLGW